MAQRKSNSTQQSLDKRIGNIENLLSQLVQSRNDISGIVSQTTGETSGNNDTRKRTASVDKDKGAKRRRSAGGNFECTLCDRTYISKTTLSRHYRINHREMSPERVHRENQVGNRSGKEKTYVDKAVSQNQINCKLCEATFNSTSARNSHYAGQHKIKDEKLLFFPNGSALVDSPLVHQIRSKPKWFKKVVKRNMSSKVCKLCEVELDMDNLKWHYENVHKVIQMDKVKTLIRLCNSDNKQVAVTQKCNYCSDVFTDTNTLKNHMLTVHASDFSECKICNKTIANTNYNDHVKNEHGDLFNKKVDVSATKLNEPHESVKKQAMPGTAKEDAKIAKDVPLIYMCDSCNLVTSSYDNVVAHSQDHILSNVTQEPVFCDICDLQFDVDFAFHQKMHLTIDNLDRDSFRFVCYDFRDVTSDKWFDMFHAFGKSKVNKVTSASIYFATRCIRFKLLSDCKDASAKFTLFQCVTCTNYVDPKCIETHVGQRNACINQCISHQCDVCSKAFYTQGARDDHMETHSIPGADSRYRTVLFNDPNDFIFNKTLLENAGKSVQIDKEGIDTQNVAKAQTPAHTKPIAVTKEVTPEGVKTVNEISNENETTSNAKPKEEKVADVYKCSCELCFHTLQSLLKHMTSCSPESRKTMRIICMCQLTFDEQNYGDHCKVHCDDITTFNIKMVSFVDVMKIDVSGMTEKFRVDYRMQQNNTKKTDKVRELKDRDVNSNQQEKINEQISSRSEKNVFFIQTQEVSKDIEMSTVKGKEHQSIDGSTMEDFLAETPKQSEGNIVKHDKNNQILPDNIAVSKNKLEVTDGTNNNSQNSTLESENTQKHKSMVETTIEVELKAKQTNQIFKFNKQLNKFHQITAPKFDENECVKYDGIQKDTNTAVTTFAQKNKEHTARQETTNNGENVARVMVDPIRSNTMVNQKIPDKAIIENNPKSKQGTNNNSSIQEKIDTQNDKNIKNSDGRNIEDYDENELLKDPEDDVNAVDDDIDITDDVDITNDEDPADSEPALTQMKAAVKFLMRSFGSKRVIEFVMNSAPKP